MPKTPPHYRTFDFSQELNSRSGPYKLTLERRIDLLKSPDRETPDKIEYEWSEVRQREGTIHTTVFKC